MDIAVIIKLIAEYLRYIPDHSESYSAVTVLRYRSDTARAADLPLHALHHMLPEILDHAEGCDLPGNESAIDPCILTEEIHSVGNHFGDSFFKDINISVVISERHIIRESLFIDISVKALKP